MAQATQQKDKYTSFNLCPEQPLLLAVHEPINDFDQSIFQTKLITQAQILMKQSCPNIQEFQLIGGSKQICTEESGPFHATINMRTEEITFSYTALPSPENRPRPTELRHESGERLLTIQPQASIDSEQETANLKQTGSTTETSEINFSPDQIQSAVDLALTSQVLKTSIQGKTILYIENKGLSQNPIATRPLFLTIQSPRPLNSGWYVIQGTFVPHHDNTNVHILWEKSCKKEWCADEN